MTKKLIGLYQLITGVFGVLLIAFNYFTKKNVDITSGIIMLQIVVGILFYGTIAWAGYGLLNKLRNAKKISLLMQALQIPAVAFSGLLYKATAGAFFAVGIENGKFAFNLDLSVIDFLITPNYANERFIMIYLVPVLILYGLSKTKD